MVPTMRVLPLWAPGIPVARKQARSGLHWVPEHLSGREAESWRAKIGKVGILRLWIRR